MKKLLTTIAGVLFVMICTVTMGQEATSKQTEEPAEDTRLGVVLDLERPSNTDILMLRNGDKLTGTILNEGFSIRTSYAKFKFNNRMIAGVDLEGGANNIEAIVTVNNNRFSGFIDDPVFVFKLQTGPQIEVRREKVLKAIFRVREAERQGIPQRQFVVLKNGDYFSGRIVTDKLTIATTYAKVPLDLANAESVRLIGGDNPLTKVFMRNKDMLQGVLETEDIEIDLDVGPKVSIYKDRIDIMFCTDGYVPVLAALSRVGRALVMDRGKHELGALFTTTSGVMKVTSVDNAGKADRAGLKVGDFFETVDGQKLNGKSHFDKVRQEILDGKRPRAVFGIRRGDKTFNVVLVQE